MKVSVIIPTYNRAHYICQAIESVLEQTFKDIEIIVVDDGSTDNTKDILKPFMEKIIYIYTENGGPAHSRNTGMKIARGEYIAFLDSDDLYYPHKTELQATILDKHPDIAMVYTEFSAFDDNGYWDEFHLRNYHTAYKDANLCYAHIFSEYKTLREAGIHHETWDNRNIFLGNIYDQCFQQLLVFTNSIMFRRDILKTIGLQDENYWMFEEYEFVLRITKYYRVAFIDLPTYKLRYHKNQISITHEKEKHICIVVMKQTSLLDITKKHCLNDMAYYLRNKYMIDKRLAVLNRALAIPLMLKGNDNKKARSLLKECTLYNHPEHLLWLITFTPFFARRILVKLCAFFRVI